MAETTTIGWTDATWNPITGCSMISAGCTHCYAQTLAGTRMKNHWSRKGLTKETPLGPVWNGEVRVNRKWLDQPLHWKKPRMVFVCAHADLFHEAVDDHWRDVIFAVMAATPHHTYQILTKRAGGARDYLNRCSQRPIESWAESMWEARDISLDQSTCRRIARAIVNAAWPLPNVWVGVSVEDQANAEHRIPLLLDTPAAVRWISAEPLLGPVDLTRLKTEELTWQDALNGRAHAGPSVWSGQRKLDWVVVGGESGRHARRMDLQWVRKVVGECHAAKVPVFVKQLGLHPGEICNPVDATDRERADWKRNGWTHVISGEGEQWNRDLRLKDKKGSDPSEWPEDLQVQEYPGNA